MKDVLLRTGAAMVGLALTLTGCAAIPTSSEVVTSSQEPADSEVAFPIPGGIPEVDAEPAAIVSSFIEAQAGVVVGNETFTHAHLTPPAQLVWEPFERVVIFGPGQVNDAWNAQTGELRYTVPVVAYLDAQGRMTQAAPGETETVTFTMTRTADDQWRIAGLPGGVIMSEANFAALYTQASLVFESVAGDVRVPELRWLPRRNTAEFAAQAVASGPSAWLAGAVMSGVSEEIPIQVADVQQEEGSVTVVLTGLEGMENEAVERAVWQYSATLGALEGVSEVTVLSAEGEVLSLPEVLPADSPIPSSVGLVIDASTWGFWDGASFENIVSSPHSAAAYALSYDQSNFAFVEGGDIYTGPLTLTATQPSPGPQDSFSLVFNGASGVALVEPSFDRYGWIWSAERTAGGDVVAVSPTGQPRIVPIPQVGAGGVVEALRVSRDGSRLAVAIREGAFTRLIVVGMTRNILGEPISGVGEPTVPLTYRGGTHNMTWVSEHQIALLSTASVGTAPEVHIVTLGGRVESLLAVTDSVQIAAHDGVGSLTLVTRTGSVHVRTVSGWSGVSIGDSQTFVEWLTYAG